MSVAKPKPIPQRSFAFVYLVVGLVIGATASWALLITDIEQAKPIVDSLVELLPTLGLAAIAIVVFLALASWRLARFVKTAGGTFQYVVEEAGAAAQAMADGNKQAAIDHAERLMGETAAWYGPIMARRWVVQTSLALLIAFGGLIGTALLFRQTLLLSEQTRKLAQQIDLLDDQNKKIDKQVALVDEQNKKIDLQTLTAEAQRRASLSVELFSILQAVSDIETEPGKTPVLKRGLQARIVALSRAATSYWIIETDDELRDVIWPPYRRPDRPRSPERWQLDEILPPKRADRPRSPERGQLLVGLLLNGVDVTELKGVTFEGADLRGADLKSAKLRGVPLKGADLSSARLSTADLTGADLTRAKMTACDLTGATLQEALLSNTDLSDSFLISANLKGAHIRDTVFTNVTVWRGLDLLQLPQGWDTPPEGWEVYKSSFMAIPIYRLRRNTARSAPQ